MNTELTSQAVKEIVRSIVVSMIKRNFRQDQITYDFNSNQVRIAARELGFELTSSQTINALCELKRGKTCGGQVHPTSVAHNMGMSFHSYTTWYEKYPARL